ncbi:MAG: FkbM family methyltransferase [Magnetococcales bacterium]|nr:FkbM family methyltransferase [Magnetococcales bacterium]MBF0321342.1 FkbM family methyltransferase [Magnetococcales bacterium]
MPILRWTMERVSDHLVFKRRMPRQFGGRPIYVTPGSALKYWRLDLGRIDPDLLRFVQTYVHPGHQVWDIGANVGLLSFAAAGLTGTQGGVLAIEPDTRLVEVIRKSLRLQENADLRLDVLPVSVASDLGISHFHIAARGRSANHLAVAKGSSQTGGTSTTYPVVTVTLDWLLEKYGKPDIIKIDVEGAEHLVMQGGERVLRDARPVFLCEVSDFNSPFISDLFKKNHYQIFDWEKNDNKPVDLAPFSTLALPR